MISILEGKVVTVLPTLNGIGKKTGNPWEKHSYVIETDEKYPKIVQVETLKPLVFEVGESVRLGVEITSREYQERWYHTISIIGKVDAEGKLIQPEASTNSSPSQDAVQAEEQALVADAAAADDDGGNTLLPF